MISDALLKQYNRQGLLVGPKETEEEFVRRAEYCLHLEKNLLPYFGTSLPDLAKQNNLSQELLNEAFPSTQSLFGITPHWVPFFFSDEKLAFWQGGCAWIFQMTEESPTAALFQLRRAWLSSNTYLKLYKREEFLAHELAHVGRMAFEEPKFEELLAYRTSPSRLRRWLGPILQTSKESWWLMCLLFSTLFSLCLALFFYDERLLDIALWLQFILLGVILYGVVRVNIRQKQFRRCLQKIEDLLGDKEQAQALVYRLTDQEIIDFSRTSLEEILQYIKEQKETSLRWRQITLSYLLPCSF